MSLSLHVSIALTPKSRCYRCALQQTCSDEALCTKHAHVATKRFATNMQRRSALHKHSHDLFLTRMHTFSANGHTSAYHTHPCKSMQARINLPRACQDTSSLFSTIVHVLVFKCLHVCLLVDIFTCDVSCSDEALHDAVSHVACSYYFFHRDIAMISLQPSS